MGGLSAPPRRSRDEVIAAARQRLVGYFEEAGRATHTFWDLYRLRRRLRHTHYLDSDYEHLRAILREAQRSLTIHLDRIATEQRWSLLLREWNKALVDAAERVEEQERHQTEQERRKAFARFASEQTEEDDEFGLGATRATAERLRDAS